MLGAGDSLRVAELMRETAASELLPRFRALAKEDIRMKRPGDVVTVADEASEQRLAVGLAKILPGVPVVGEEAVENDASLLDLIGRQNEVCWIVDPLDGTANFAAGKNTFTRVESQTAFDLLGFLAVALITMIGKERPDLVLEEFELRTAQVG